MEVKISTIDEEFEKAQVKGFTRTRRGKMERVKPFSRFDARKIWNKMSEYQRYKFIDTPTMGKIYNVGSISETQWSPHAPHSEDIMDIFRKRPKQTARLKTKLGV